MKAHVVMLSSGDTVICNLVELSQGEGEDKRGLCLEMTHPYKLEFVDSVESKEVQVKFTRWMAFSSEFKFKIPYSAVITLAEPEPNMLKVYEQKVDDAKKKIEDAKKKSKPKVYASDVSVAGVGMGFGGR